MSAMLDTLRAIAHGKNARGQGNERNERNELSGTRGALNSFNSFNSSSGTVANSPLSPSQIAAREDSVVHATGVSDDFAERAAIVEEGAGVPRTWAEGYARLCTMQRPGSVPERRWQALIDNAGQFIDRWAVQASALGWDTSSVFGCHPTHADARRDLKGLVWLIDDGAVVAISAASATLRTHTGVTQHIYRRVPVPGEPLVAMWELEP